MTTVDILIWCLSVSVRLRIVLGPQWKRVYGVSYLR